MDYPIAIDPGLDLDLDDLVAAWNETPACRALAQAQLFAPEAQSFTPELAQQGLILLTGAATAASALALDALKDALRARLSAYFEQKLERKPALEIEWQRQPGGGHLLVVTPQEQ
jgi:hypothetical protein